MHILIYTVITKKEIKGKAKKLNIIKNAEKVNIFKWHG